MEALKTITIILIYLTAVVLATGSAVRIKKNKAYIILLIFGLVLAFFLAFNQLLPMFLIFIGV